MASTKGTWLLFFVTQIGHSAHTQELCSWRASLFFWPSRTTAISKAVKAWLPREAQDEAMPVTLPWGQLLQGRRVKRRRVWGFSFPHKELRVHWSIRKMNPASIPSMYNFQGNHWDQCPAQKQRAWSPATVNTLFGKFFPYTPPKTSFFQILSGVW